MRPPTRSSPAPGCTAATRCTARRTCSAGRPRLRAPATSNYREGTLAAGHVLTVEPGLYFQLNDRTVPPELRGIGVRIEDDIVVTDGEPVNLSAMLPRDPDGVLAWMRDGAEFACRPMSDSSCVPAAACRTDSSSRTRSWSNGSAGRPAGRAGREHDRQPGRAALGHRGLARARRPATREAAAPARPAADRRRAGVVASEHRSQLQNRTAARARLAALVGEALRTAGATASRDPPVPSREARRVDAKRQRGELKSVRRRPLD